MFPGIHQAFVYHIPRAFVRSILFILVLALAGCQSMFYKPTGKVMVSYSQDEAVPYTLALSDPMMGCALGEAFSPFLLSFERTSVDVDRVAILMNTLSGFCAQTRAWEAELRQLRAVNSNNSAEVKDALSEKKRFEALAAQRQYKGYLRLVTAFGEPGDSCPVFQSDQDEFFYLIGLINGLQASQNNIASNQTSGVPMSVVNKVGRGAACLDGEKWWGIPSGMQAVVWTMLPMNKPKEANPEAMLRAASQLGIQHGVRLSHVLESEVHNASSRTQNIKDIIAEYAQSLSDHPADARVKLIDGMARSYMQFFSDRIWTMERGYRTPHGQFGEFWQPRVKQLQPAMDIDDLI